MNKKAMLLGVVLTAGMLMPAGRVDYIPRRARPVFDRCVYYFCAAYRAVAFAIKLSGRPGWAS